MKIEHVAIWAEDIDVLKSFYETYFGGQANDRYTNSTKGFSSFFLRFASGARLELMQMPSVLKTADSPYDQATGYTHLAFSVGCENTVNELTARLAADGFKVLDGPRRTGDGYYESVVLDPEHNRIEITI